MSNVIRTIALNQTSVTFSANAYAPGPNTPGTPGGMTYPTETFSYDPSAYQLISIYYTFKSSRTSYRVTMSGSEINQSCTANETVTLPFDQSVWSGQTSFASGSSSPLAVTFWKYMTVALNHLYTEIALNVELKPIASVSTATVATVYVGEAQTVTITNPISTVKHRVIWTYGFVTSGVLDFPANNRTPSWAVPADQVATVCGLVSGNASETEITGSVFVVSLSEEGSTLGSNTYTAKLRMTSTQGAPTVSLTITKTHDAVGTSIGTGYVQNHTTLSITPTVTTKYGATAGTVRIVTPDGVLTTTSGTAKSILIKTAGTYEVNASVTDSRGFVGSVRQTITVTACEYPSATSLSAFRCTSAGAANDDGTYIRVEATATITSYAQSYTVTVEHRETGTTGAWVNGGTLTDGSLIMSRSGGFEAESSYDLRVTISDNLGQETIYNLTVTSALYTIHRMAGGTGVAFGKVAEKTGVEVRADWPFYVYGSELQHLLVDTAHPVGSVLESLDSAFNPNTLWPWTLWGKIEDVFLLGAGSKVVGATGGTTKLTLDMLPQYAMRFRASGGCVYNFQASGNSQISYRNDQDDFMPPYMAVNIWVRAK